MEEHASTAYGKRRASGSAASTAAETVSEDAAEIGDDSDYQPAEPGESHQTPIKRRKASSSLLTFQLRDVDEEVKKLSPNSTSAYCVVTLTTFAMGIVEYAHVVRASTPIEVITLLEWVWRAKCGSLDVDTHRNIIPLDVSLRIYFNNNGWFFLPENLEVILDMYEFYVGVGLGNPVPSEYPNGRRNPEEFYSNKEQLSYRFVPFPAMMETSCVRRAADSVLDSGFPRGTPVTQFYYPFESMPSISLHVPYHFVIYDTGRKLIANYKDEPIPSADFPGLSATERVTLTAIRGMYKAWMNAQPSDAWKADSSPPMSSTGGPTEGSRQSDSGDPSKESRGQGSGDRASGGDDTGGKERDSCGEPLGHGNHAQSTSSSGPDDCGITQDLKVAGEVSGEPMDEEGELEDSDEEWEDPAWVTWLQEWAEDVWEAMQGEVLPPPDDQDNLVGVAEAEKDWPSMVLWEAQDMTNSS